MNLQESIQALGLAGQPVCIHSSLRSFGQRMEGLLEAFLQSGCTVLAPTFSDMYEAPPVPEYMPENNGAGDYSYFYSKTYEDVGVYTPESNLFSQEDMGAFPAMVLAHPERERGNNYLNSFAAVGPLAKKLVSGQTNEAVYAPLETLYEMDGYVLLIGTGLDTATAIHYAEQGAGRIPFVRWAKDAAGRTVPVSAGSCSGGFGNFSGALAPYEKTVTLGKSVLTCYPIRQLVDTCVAEMQKNPRITHCGDPECGRCNDAVLGGPILPENFWDLG